LDRARWESLGQANLRIGRRRLRRPDRSAKLRVLFLDPLRPISNMTQVAGRLQAPNEWINADHTSKPRPLATRPP
jgi:hypothetical protein